MSESLAFHSVLQASYGSDGQRIEKIKPSDVFSFFDAGPRLIEIPKYQRPYSWSQQNIKEFLLDVHNLDLNNQWFLGPIFIVKNPDSDDDVKLLDGQQRITSTVLILLELYRLIYIYNEDFGEYIEESEDGEVEESIKNKYKELKNFRSNIQRALIAIKGSNNVSRFVAGEKIRDTFKDFIIKWFNINRKEKFNTASEKFIRDLDNSSLIGYPSAKNSSTVFKYVKEFFKNLKDDDGNLYIEDNLNDIFFISDFTYKLLHRLWVIEVPLVSESTSIRIFESLNNRGKPLTLIDKFRYRTLIHESIIHDLSKSEKISKKWTDIYTLFSQTNEDSESFYQYFFMSKAGDEISKSKHSVFFEIFSEHYSKTEDDINKFLDETTYFLKFLKACNNFDTVFDEFIVGDEITPTISSDKKNKAIGLFELSRRGIRYSEQVKLLYFKMLRKRNNPELDAYSIFIEMFKINYFVFIKIYEGKTRSNDFRNDCLEFCKNPKSLKELIDNVKIDLVKDLSNKIVSNNEESHFLLIFYTYLTDSKILVNYSKELVNKSQVEHLMPRAWMENWEDARDFSITDAKDLLEELIAEKKFKKLELKGLFNYLDSEVVPEFEPKEYTTSVFRNTKTIIEFIGNRWILDKLNNIAVSNDDFSKKKVQFTSQQGLKFPDPDSEIGINKYTEWTSKEILLRSLEIIESLHNKFELPLVWDSFD